MKITYFDRLFGKSAESVARRSSRRTFISRGLWLTAFTVVALRPFRALAACEGSNCCGNNSYDPNTQGCCNGSIYDLSTQACCTSTSGTNVYTTSTQGCCGDGVYTKSTQGCCCSQTTYTLDYHDCCVGCGPCGECTVIETVDK